MAERLLVTGAGGFIGHHLVNHLVAEGYWVRGADVTSAKYERSNAHQFDLLDLRYRENCLTATRDIDQVYHLAADTGDIGDITARRAETACNDSLINVHLLEAARQNDVKRFLFASSACVYPQYLQRDADLRPLREDDAWPADPEEGCGLEKLYTEKLCQYYTEDYGFETRVVRFHDVFGPLADFHGGRATAPAAVCRKVALAAPGGEIEVSGDGKQACSFLYVSDCVEGMHRLMRSDCSIPLNLDTEVRITAAELVAAVAGVAGKKIRIRHSPSGPHGVRDRKCDNTLLRYVLGWEPQVSLAEGLVPTYAWIARQMAPPDADADDRDAARPPARRSLWESTTVAYG